MTNTFKLSNSTKTAIRNESKGWMRTVASLLIDYKNGNFDDVDKFARKASPLITALHAEYANIKDMKQARQDGFTQARLNCFKYLQPIINVESDSTVDSITKAIKDGGYNLLDYRRKASKKSTGMSDSALQALFKSMAKQLDERGLLQESLQELLDAYEVNLVEVAE